MNKEMAALIKAECARIIELLDAEVYLPRKGKQIYHNTFYEYYDTKNLAELKNKMHELRRDTINFWGDRKNFKEE